MQITDIITKTALVLETNNLRGTTDPALLATSLKRLITILSKQTVSLDKLAQVVITHDGLPDRTCQEITALAGYPIDFVLLQANTGYYEAKNIGFDSTHPQLCQYVVFGDSDCIPDKNWLEQMLLPFATTTQTTSIVAGRTSYAATVVGTSLTTIDFMYFPSRVQAGTTANFYANNVAFQREVFERYRYQPLKGVYRAQCQVLGLRLQAEGIPLHYASQAHTVHRLPDTRRQALRLRWIRGQDSVALTSYLVRNYLPSRWQWLGHSGPLGPLCVMAGRLVYSLRALNQQNLPPMVGLRWLATISLILGFSAVDTLGALARGMGIDTVSRAAGDAQALSYHGR